MSLDTLYGTELRYSAFGRLYMPLIDRKPAGASSIAITEILEEIDRAAASNARVLISGSATTRKELIARRIHEQSARCMGPFVSMTCAGVRSDFLGSLFFGQSDSRTTGSHLDTIGWLERANRGTLFIDEIGELDSRLQEALLTFIETGEVRRGGSRPDLATDVRIITASGRDLHQEVIAGRFNAALFYRLNIIHIVVPERHPHAQEVSRHASMQSPFRLELDAS